MKNQELVKLVRDSGYRDTFIAQNVGMSVQCWWNKKTGYRPFRRREFRRVAEFFGMDELTLKRFVSRPVIDD